MKFLKICVIFLSMHTSLGENMVSNFLTMLMSKSSRSLESTSETKIWNPLTWLPGKSKPEIPYNPDTDLTPVSEKKNLTLTGLELMILAVKVTWVQAQPR
jgi:hypothetical protein